MASRRFRRELAEHIPEWEQRGWLSPGAATALRAEYPVSEKSLAVGTIVRALLGAALLVGGLLLVLAHSWADLERGTRVALSLAPLAITVALGLWTLLRGKESVALRESLALANSLAIALALSLISETYNLSGDIAGFILCWSLCSLPFALVMEGAAAWVLFQLLAMLWVWNARSDAWALPGYLALAFASLCICLPRVWTEKKRRLGVLLAVAFFLGFTGALGATFFPVSGSAWRFSAYALWFGIVWLAGDFGFSKAGGYLRVLSSLGLVAILVFLGFGDTWKHFYFSGSGELPTLVQKTARILWLGGLGLALLGLVLARFRRLEPLSWLALGAALFPLLGAWLRGRGFEPLDLMVLANVYGALFAIEALRSGLKEMDAIRINLGWLLFSALVVSRFFDSELGYLLRGFAFIALGLGFLGVNVWLKMRRKRERVRSEDAR